MLRALSSASKLLAGLGFAVLLVAMWAYLVVWILVR